MIKFFLAISLLFIGGCESEKRTEATEGPRTPKSSYGEAVYGAKSLDSDVDERNNHLESQTKDLFEDL